MMSSYNLHAMSLIHHHSVLLAGEYLVQDAVFCEKSSDALMIASQKETALDFKEYLITEAIRFRG